MDKYVGHTFYFCISVWLHIQKCRPKILYISLFHFLKICLIASGKYSEKYLHWLQNSELYPGLQPFIHVPFMWWHCDIFRQRPHLFWHMSPNIPSLQSTDIKITFITLQFNKWLGGGDYYFDVPSFYVFILHFDINLMHSKPLVNVVHIVHCTALIKYCFSNILRKTSYRQLKSTDRCPVSFTW